MQYDLTIIGGGPAGVAAGVYAARKRLKTLFITETFGGQSTESVGIENWIGIIKIAGADFGKVLEDHLRAYAGEIVDIHTGTRAKSVSQAREVFSVVLEDGSAHESKAVLVTAGSTRRKLEVPGAKEFEHKGVVYCASCDGPLFADQDVIVIGGGNAGFETAAQLLAYCKSVTLLNRSDSFKADPVTVAKVKAHPKMNIVTKAVPVEVRGGSFVTSLMYENADTHEKTELPVQGVFVEIGLIPSTALAKDLVETNQYGQIVVDPRNQRTSRPGVWAAGDCTDGLFHQNNIAAGDAVKALEDIYLQLHTK